MQKKPINRNQLNYKAPKRCCSTIPSINKISTGHKICIATVTTTKSVL